MAIESKNHRPSTVDHVRVSEGSRRDAHPADGMRFETYREELDHHIAIKQQIALELSAYSKAAFAGEQARIRREHSGNEKASFNAWISRKASMETKRQQLVKRLSDVETEILRLKPLVRLEHARMVRPAKQDAGALDAFKMFRDDGTLCWDGVAAEMLLELRAIRKLLASSKS